MKTSLVFLFLLLSTLTFAQPANEICCDREIAMGSRITSPNGRYFVIFQTDKNVVLYKKTSTGDKALWHTNTANHATRTVMQADGNFVLYENAKPIWASNTYGNLNRNSKLVMQDDGNLVIYSIDNRPIWATNTAQAAEPEVSNEICCDRQIAMGTRITSPNGKYFLIFQTDKNVVLYKKTDAGDKALWHTNTANHATRTVMQADGNFVLYENAKPIWASNTYGNKNATLVVQDDGNMVIYSTAKRALWATNTAQAPEPEVVALPVNQLCCDREIVMGSRITSPNGNFFLIFQNDRNVVLYKKTGAGDKALWHTNTANHTTRTVMQADGNLVLYENAKAIWASNTSGNRNASLVLQDDGNLVIYSTDKRALWATNTAQAAEPAPQPVVTAPVTNQICCDREIAIGSRITSPNGVYFVIFQNDRNVVLYKKTTEGDLSQWHTNTAGHTTRTVMQADGNFVLYEGTKAIWASNTYGNRNAALVMQDDGNLVIYSTDQRALWTSNTAEVVQPVQQQQQLQPVEQVLAPVTTTVVTTTGPCGMSSAQYNAAVGAINGQAFRDGKMSTAKLAIKNKCLTLDQVRGIASLFAFEDQTLEFVLHAYDFTDAKDEYYTLESLFKFNSNKEELNEFLSKK
jgi:phosphoribosyl-AMP cyclohydrolase